MSRQQSVVLPLLLFLLLATAVSGARAQGGAADCSTPLGGIGAICRIPGPNPAIEVWGTQHHERGRHLLRVTQAQVDNIAPGNFVAGTADGRVAVHVEPDGHVTISMGPDHEGKVHHVTLENTLFGRALDKLARHGGPPGAPARPATVIRRGALVARQPAQEDGAIVHVVRRGQTLGAIARAYNVRQREIMDLNGLVNPHRIYVGQWLLIQKAPPARPEHCRHYEPVIHVVRRGENITRIARRFGVHPESLAIRNELPRKGQLIHAGLRLVIPDAWTHDGEAVSLPADCVDAGRVVHIVRAGHTLNAIARAWNVAPATLVELNRLTQGGHWLRIGQLLVIREAIEEPQG